MRGVSRTHDRSYRDLVKNEVERVLLMDDRLSADTIEQQIWNQLVARFPVLASSQRATANPQP